MDILPEIAQKHATMLILLKKVSKTTKWKICGTSVCEECAMMCTELQYEDADKDLVVYGDQGINTEEYEKATYGDLTKTQSEEEEEVKYSVAQSANDIML